MPERCPTCGGEVRVVGRTTMHYEPVSEHADVMAAYDEWAKKRRVLAPAILVHRLANLLRRDA